MIYKEESLFIGCYALRGKKEQLCIILIDYVIRYIVLKVHPFAVVFRSISCLGRRDACWTEHARTDWQILLRR